VKVVTPAAAPSPAALVDALPALVLELLRADPARLRAIERVLDLVKG
jgi:hypothetical protein